MKLFLISVLSTFLLSSCAHHHKDVKHHHHKSCDANCKVQHEKGEMFKKHCAQSVAEGDLHVQGSDEYKISHGNEIYYFSTEEKLNKFKKHLSKNAKSARRNWDAGSSRR
jgi:YHS domain-containing protein